jgi:hypothetical protein
MVRFMTFSQWRLRILARLKLLSSQTARLRLPTVPWEDRFLTVVWRCLNRPPRSKIITYYFVFLQLGVFEITFVWGPWCLYSPDNKANSWESYQVAFHNWIPGSLRSVYSNIEALYSIPSVNTFFMWNQTSGYSFSVSLSLDLKNCPISEYTLPGSWLCHGVLSDWSYSVKLPVQSVPP